MHDLVIIGSGPAGLSAAVYAKRACLDVVVLEKEPMGGGQMIYTQEVDNYLGLPETNGFDLAQKFEQHAKALEVPFISDEVDNVEKNTDGTLICHGSKELLEKAVNGFYIKEISSQTEVKNSSNERKISFSNY